MDGQAVVITLVRHPPIDPTWSGRCYGQSDVPLADSDYGELVESLVTRSPAIVWHSGLSRTRLIAEDVARRAGTEIRSDSRLLERNFGAWEGRSWDAIYAETGDAMNGMIDAPATWCPPDGETTFAMRDRVIAWFRELDDGIEHVAITHGGPIAALLAVRDDLPPSEWISLVPAYGAVIELSMSNTAE